MTPRVLVVEDEPNIRELVCLHLGHEGYTCEGVGDGTGRAEASRGERFDLLVLDVMIPGLDGLSLCRAVRNGRIEPRRADPDADGAPGRIGQGRRPRERRRRLPDQAVRRPRARGPGARAAAASASGAPPALRVQRRRASAPSGFTASTSIWRAGACNVEGRDVELTDQEFRLLHLLATHAGIVFSREALLARIWRGDTFVTVRSVDTLVKRLRRRIEADPAQPAVSADGLGRRLQVRRRLKRTAGRDDVEARGVMLELSARPEAEQCD